VVESIKEKAGIKWARTGAGHGAWGGTRPRCALWRL